MKKTIEQIMNENNIQNQLSIEQLLATDWAKQFNKNQLYQITWGLEEGLDVTTYAYKEFNEKQMEQIIDGLKANLNVSIYTRPEFTWQQMRQLRIGLEKGIDVTVFAKPEYTLDQMEQIRYGLQRNVDVTIYARPEFTWQQMQQIYFGLLSNIDVTIYAKTEYTPDQMEQICLGLVKGLDVSIYAHYNVNSLLMKIFYDMLLMDKFIKEFEKMNYNNQQATQLTLGLLNKIDFKLYLDIHIPDEKMKEIRLSLQKAKYQKNNQNLYHEIDQEERNKFYKILDLAKKQLI